MSTHLVLPCHSLVAVQQTAVCRRETPSRLSPAGWSLSGLLAGACSGPPAGEGGREEGREGGRKEGREGGRDRCQVVTLHVYTHDVTCTKWLHK